MEEPVLHTKDVMLTGMQEWDQKLKALEYFLEYMVEFHEPVYSSAYQWMVRFKYMPMFAEQECDIVCLHELKFVFVEAEVAIMFD